LQEQWRIHLHIVYLYGPLSGVLISWLLAAHAVFLSHDLEISSRDLSKPHGQPIKTPESGAPAVVRLRFRFLR
jgi:hypothetical protein